MTFLELKIPPVFVFAFTGLLMWLTSLITHEIGIPGIIRFGFGIIMFLIGGIAAIAGVLNFKKSKTTISPVKLHNTRFLVCSGIYGYTRNPMYLGLLFTLLAWACFLDNFFSLLLVFVFQMYITRFQIKPEEKILKKFGRDYERYKKRVRRWL